MDENNKEYVEFKAIKVNNHKHDIQPNVVLQIIGEDRSKVALDIINKHQGFVKRYIQSLNAAKATSVA